MYDRLSFESISGYLLSFSLVLGAEWQDAMYFGQLLGEKTIINEFIAYPHLGDIQDELSNKTIIMATYVLCGFANIVSIGIQVGGIGILVPNKSQCLLVLDGFLNWRHLGLHVDLSFSWYALLIYFKKKGL